ncbi:hypothetical protein O3W44_22305 [Pantoea sp. LMR881]|uniref:hypothetical protein n=1 Tax=Pantoea sp. LMR881 TaxID=3014336 RepID=UPI0022AFD653|nr:hypothetical protein [Pantoea sp. LMR881]MCZ4061266.1 hypothetical protein [Pantoea sp. LMR881]
MWALFKTAWMTLGTFKNIKRYVLVAIAIIAVLGGFYVVYSSQVKTIAIQAGTIKQTGEKLGSALQENELLKLNVKQAKQGREEAEQKYVRLDAEQQANAIKLEEVERENNALGKRIFKAQKTIPALIVAFLITLSGCTSRQSEPSTKNTVVVEEQHKPVILPAQMCVMPVELLGKYGDYPETFLPALITSLSAVNDHNITVNQLNGAVTE